MVVEEINVPVLDLDQARYVELGTVMVVMMGFAWICRMLFGGGFTFSSPLKNAGRRRQERLVKGGDVDDKDKKEKSI